MRIVVGDGLSTRKAFHLRSTALLAGCPERKPGFHVELVPTRNKQPQYAEFKREEFNIVYLKAPSLMKPHIAWPNGGAPLVSLLGFETKRQAGHHLDEVVRVKNGSRGRSAVELE